MKARITTVLSLTGVLVAGSAAALVNTQVLQNTADKSTSASEITVDDQPESVSTVATTPVSNPGSVPNKFQDLGPVVVTAAAVAPASTQQSYAIGDAGNVVLDTANGGLAVVAITPSAGWTVVEHQNTDPLSIEVKFQSATTRVEFKANVLYGVVAWETESELLEQPTTSDSTGGTTGVSSGRTPPTNTVDDGDDSGSDQHDDESDDGHHGGSDDDD